VYNSVNGFVMELLLVDNPQVIQNLIHRFSTDTIVFLSCFSDFILLYLSYDCVARWQVIHNKTSYYYDYIKYT